MFRVKYGHIVRDICDAQKDESQFHCLLFLVNYDHKK